MTKFNDFNMDNWKTLSDIETDSLWFIDKRDKSGKHDGFYHGNFVPQIPHQLILRYTKKNDTVLDAFMGSGTTAYECETLRRNFVGVDIKQDMVDYVKSKLDSETIQNQNNIFTTCIEGDSSNPEITQRINTILQNNRKNCVQLVILHPPYFDILKFSNNPNDLSNAKNIKSFLDSFGKVVENCMRLLEKDRYMAIVIGDKYSGGEWIPLGFYCMNETQKRGLKLKSIIIKNIDGNRAKQGKNDIWRYRALTSDYYIFKHEYILLFKKS